MDGMKVQPSRLGAPSTGATQLAADQALTDGENQCLIWSAFAKRGLGFSAVQGSSEDRSDGTEAFDTHPDCSP
jgi:extracellular elastinolytic metalloproteinase